MTIYMRCETCGKESRCFKYKDGQKYYCEAGCMIEPIDEKDIREELVSANPDIRDMELDKIMKKIQ